MATSAVPLNTFRTYTYYANSTPTVVYTTPSNITTVILLAQVSNTDTANTITSSAWHSRSGKLTNIITNIGIPVFDAVNLLTGKLVLETGDSFVLSANTFGSGSLLLANSAQVILSILETSNS
jgi:hypothetical protein